MALGPYSKPFYLIQWGGSLPGGETWSCSLKACQFSSVLGVDANEGSAGGYADGWTAAVKAFHMRVTSYISPRAKLNFVKTNAIGVDGKQMYPNTIQRVFADIDGGGDPAGPQYPNQVAMVVTLTTDINRGYGSKGRFYLPLPCMATDPATGLVSVANADNLRTSARTFLEAISDTPGVDILDPAAPQVAVMSRHSGNPTARQVKGVSIGRVLDTQRRRRRSLKELYEKVDVDFGDG